MVPKGIIVRKVRASQSRITDNVRPGRPAGKCNRNKPPQLLYSIQNLNLEKMIYHTLKGQTSDKKMEIRYVRYIAIVVRMERRGKSSPVSMAT